MSARLFYIITVVTVLISCSSQKHQYYFSREQELERSSPGPSIHDLNYSPSSISLGSVKDELGNPEGMVASSSSPTAVRFEKTDTKQGMRIYPDTVSRPTQAPKTKGEPKSKKYDGVAIGGFSLLMLSILTAALGAALFFPVTFLVLGLIGTIIGFKSTKWKLSLVGLIVVSSVVFVAAYFYFLAAMFYGVE